MKRRTLGISSILFLLVFVVVIPSVLAVVYRGDLITDKKYELKIVKDEYTELNDQNIKIEIKKVVSQSAESGAEDDFDSYTPFTRPAEWHCEFDRGKTDAADQAYNTSVIKPDNEVTFIGAETYPQAITKNSLYFQHFHKTGTYIDLCEAWKEIPAAPIGEITFWVMPHLNATVDGDPSAKLHFSIGSTNNQTGFVNGYFVTNDNTIGLFLYKFNDTNNQKTYQSVYNATTSDKHGWFRVKVFYDAFNDLYNLTIKQIVDWNLSGGKKTTPVIPTAEESFIITGEANNGYERINEGTRLYYSSLVNRIQFKLEAIQSGRSSFAWVDNIEVQTYNFPATYADILFENSTIKKDYGRAQSFFNNTVISSYRAPDFPDQPELDTSPNRNYSVSYNDDYFEKYTSKEYLLGWESAPCWQYAIPLVIPTDNLALVQKSIEKMITSTNPYLEELGQTSILPFPSGYNKLTDSVAFLGFTFTEAELISDIGVMRFKFETSEDYVPDRYTLNIEYFWNGVDDGMLYKILIYRGSSTANSYVIMTTLETDLAIPGYPLLFTLGIIFVTVSVLLSKYRKKTIKS